jgi:hypothetical protein
MTDGTDETTPLRSVTFKLSADDIGRLRYLAQRRYPGDRNVMARTLRDVIREAYTRAKRQAEREAEREESGK